MTSVEHDETSRCLRLDVYIPFSGAKVAAHMLNL